MGSRTRAANHLGDLLSRDTPRKPPLDDLRALARRFRDWKAELYQGAYVEKGTLAEQAFAHVTELQGEIIAQAAHVRGPEVPPGKP